MGAEEEPSSLAIGIDEMGVATRSGSDAGGSGNGDPPSSGSGRSRNGGTGSGNGGAGHGGPPDWRGRRREHYPRHKQELHIAELINLLIRIHKLTDIVREYRVYIFWKEMVDAKIATNMSPVSLSKGVLQVHARSSVWMHESCFFRARMIAQINRWVGAPPLLSDIRFSLSTPSRGEQVEHDLLPRLRREAEARRAPPRQPPASVSQADREAICAQTSVIEDNDLRAIIERVRLEWNL